MLTADGCRNCQRRLSMALEGQGCDLFVTSDASAAYYFTGSFSPADTPVIFAQWQTGTTLLVTSGS
jgi:hypothetical protein